MANHRARLEQKAKSLGLSEQIIFTGRISEHEKALYRGRISHAELRRGVFGVVFLEALACGVPVIGSKVDGSHEALLDGQLGCLSIRTCPRSW
jgi:glycosyltransferase involved in cell wall biosynthesis